MANLKQYIKTSFQNYDLPSNTHSGHSYGGSCAQEDITYLYNKIKDFSRETTQWDLYKITQVIQNQENFQGQVNALPPYSSAIIAAKFIENNEIYSPGDLVYKKLDNSTEHITAERGGVFYPSKIAKDNNSNNIDMYFTYMTKEPSASNESQTAKKLEDGSYGFNEQPNSQTLIYDNIGIIDPTKVYGHLNPENNSFPAVENVFPIIKLYNDDNEEVYADFILTFGTDINTGKEIYTISTLPSIVTKVVVK